MNKDAKKELLEIIKKLEGTVLSVSIDNDIVKDAILKNKKINNNLCFKSKSKFRPDAGFEDVSINKLKKKIKFKVDTIICDINGINMYIWKVIKNSYKLTNDKVIFFGYSDDYDINKIVDKYVRYGGKKVVKKFDDFYIVVIDVSNLEIKTFKKIIYNTKDFVIDVNDAIGNGLMQ